MRDLLAVQESWYAARVEEMRVWREEIASVKDLLAAGVDSPEAAAKLVPTRRPGTGSVAVIPVSGFLTQRPTFLSMLFGGTSVEAVAADVAAAMRDSSISSVVLHVDSPGGSVHGVPEAAAKIRAARGPKPLFAVADSLAASAAYWLAAQADEVIGAPSSLVGSIGVIVEHADVSAALEKEGVKVSVIRSGPDKNRAHMAEPLDDEARAELQAKVDYFARMFEADVAKGRRVSVEKVRSDFGEGLTFTPPKALTAGLIDREATLEEVIGQAAKGRRPESMGPAPRGYDAGEVAIRARLAGWKLK